MSVAKLPPRLDRVFVFLSYEQLLVHQRVSKAWREAFQSSSSTLQISINHFTSVIWETVSPTQFNLRWGQCTFLDAKDADRSENLVKCLIESSTTPVKAPKAPSPLKASRKIDS